MKKMISCVLFPILLVLLTTINTFAFVNSAEPCLQQVKIPNSDNSRIVTVGGTDTEYFNESLKTSDGGYLLAGYITQAFYNHDILIIKVSADGEIEWQKTYDGQGSDYPMDIIEINNGYVIAGTSNDDGLVMKLFLDGSIAWQKNFGSSKYDSFHSIVQTNDNGFLITGYTEDLGHNIDYDALVVKINNNGSLVWQKTFEIYNEFDNAILTNDGRYLLVGSELNTIGGGKFGLLVLNSDGSIYWEKEYSFQYEIGVSDLIETNDGNYVLLGNYKHIFGSVEQFYDVFLLKINSAGEIVWKKAYGSQNSYSLNGIYETINGDLIATGLVSDDDTGSFAAWVLKLSSDGKLIWQKSYGPLFAIFDSTIENFDNSLTFFGSAQPFGKRLTDWILVITDKNGEINNCDFYDDGSALPSDVGSISISTRSSPVSNVSRDYSNSTLEVNPIDLPITNICPQKYLYLPYMQINNTQPGRLH